MELEVIQCIAAELNEALRYGFITKIHQPLPREIVLRIRGAGSGEKSLVMSADPRTGRVHLTSLRLPNPPRPPRFCAFLRAHFQGARILEVSCLPDDRVITVSTVYGPRDTARRTDLILELLGRDSNIILRDCDTNTILDCLHHIPDRETTTRAMLPGFTYTAPPQPPRVGRSSSVNGIDARPTIPGIVYRPDGRKQLTMHADPDTDTTFETMNQAADALYREELEGSVTEALRREIAGRARAKIKSLRKRIRKVDADAERMRDLAARHDEGELLKGNLHRIKKGMTHIEVTDWSTGEAKQIALDPKLTPVENMEALFKASARGKRGRSHAEERLEITKQELAAWEERLFFIEQAEGPEDLAELSRESEPELPPKPNHGEKRSAASGTGAGKAVRTYRTPAGAEVLVGRTAAGNDEIVRSRAKKGDIWLHVKGAPGAHVLLPMRGRKESRTEDIEYAAGLAVHFSRRRGKGRTDVMVADPKDIRKPKGASPGQVTVSSYRTVSVEGIDPEADDAAI